MNFLEIRNLTKEFGKLSAVNNVSFEVQKGSVVAIIGPNGAGKSTLFNLVTGYFAVSSGKIFFKDEEITDLPPYKILQKGISRSFQVSNIFPNLTAFENVRIGVLSHRRKSMKLFSLVEEMDEINEETSKLLKALGLSNENDTVASTLSHGDQKKLEIGIALTNEPALLLLDEPTAGMAPEETVNTVNLIKDISNKQNTTIVFTEHDLNVVFSIAERIIVLQQGSIIADGTGEEIKGNKKVKEAYLGEEV
jgi:branched-chain amino acid transport system ATP-binding protein